jgi:hypothetical protein
MSSESINMPPIKRKIHPQILRAKTVPLLLSENQNNNSVYIPRSIPRNSSLNYDSN